MRRHIMIKEREGKSLTITPKHSVTEGCMKQHELVFKNQPSWAFWELPNLLQCGERFLGMNPHPFFDQKIFCRAGTGETRMIYSEPASPPAQGRHAPSPLPRPRNPRALTRLVARNDLEGLPCRTARYRGVCAAHARTAPQVTIHRGCIYLCDL
jgi:hypothetical protein